MSVYIVFIANRIVALRMEQPSHDTRHCPPLHPASEPLPGLHTVCSTLRSHQSRLNRSLAGYCPQGTLVTRLVFKSKGAHITLDGEVSARPQP